jgi:phenol hydroxylase P1 protein
MSAYGYGVSITQAASMCGMDRLGIAQYITRIGLMLDGNSGDALKTAKAAWQNNPAWQPMRELTENMLTTEDWFELFVAQNLVLDGLIYPLMYQSFSDLTSASGQTSFAMMTEFMSEWYEEHVRWVDNIMKVAVAESDSNKAQLAQWIQQWQPKILQALQPVAQQALGSAAQAGLDAAVAQLSARLGKIKKHYYKILGKTQCLTKWFFWRCKTTKMHARFERRLRQTIHLQWLRSTQAFIKLMRLAV